MTDILIRMEMPFNCWKCPFVNSLPCPCSGYSEMLNYTTKRHPNCPLHELPAHGDLIDKQETFKALSEKFKNSDGFVSWTDAIDIVLRAQEIVPSNKEENE